MTTTKITDKTNKYFVAIQNFINDNNFGLVIKRIDIAFAGRNARSILIVFESNKKTQPIPECFIRCTFETIPNTISGGSYAYLSDEDNEKIRKIRYFVGNMFWIWLSYYDYHFNKELARFSMKHRLLELENGGFEERKSAHPFEFQYTSNFKELIDLFNSQVNDGLFGDKTPIMDISDVDFNTFKYINPMDNIFH